MIQSRNLSITQSPNDSMIQWLHPSIPRPRLALVVGLDQFDLDDLGGHLIILFLKGRGFDGGMLKSWLFIRY
jgi:hypothetical protein